MSPTLMLRHTLTLDHAPTSLDPDDVLLYRLGGLHGPPLFEPGAAYEPASPAWVAALVTAEGGMPAALWCRAFRLTAAEHERRRLEREAHEAAAAAQEEDARWKRADRRLRALWGQAAIEGEWPGLDRAKASRVRALVAEARRRDGREAVNTTYRNTPDGMREALWEWARREPTDAR